MKKDTIFNNDKELVELLECLSDLNDFLDGFCEDLREPETKVDEQKFILNDLGTGNIVTFRNGFMARAYRGIKESSSDLLIVNPKLRISVDNSFFKRDLTSRSNEEYDIVKVERASSLFDIAVDVEKVKDKTVVWERTYQKKTITKDEICKMFGCADFDIK